MTPVVVITCCVLGFIWVPACWFVCEHMASKRYTRQIYDLTVTLAIMRQVVARQHQVHNPDDDNRPLPKPIRLDAQGKRDTRVRKHKAERDAAMKQYMEGDRGVDGNRD